MIVCSCNVLSDGEIRACLNPGPQCPRTPAQVYQCLGCRAECGHCARTIRAIMDQAVTAAEAGGPCRKGCCSLASGVATGVAPSATPVAAAVAVLAESVMVEPFS